MSNGSEGDVITIILVDDIPETRENIKKLLAFEQDLKVIGTAGTGREGVALAEELRPDIIIMDINMPDMDGIQATTLITEKVPTTAVIMMSVQNDPDYLRRAMLAGARNFLTKPIAMEELYNTIRTVHARNKPIAAQYAAVREGAISQLRTPSASTGTGGRAGQIITVYSPQGGVGTTTVAISLASGLMREGVKVLLVDADLQFGDVGANLNVQTQTTIVDLVEEVDDLDTDHFENIVATHDSGLKVLLGPSRPEYADTVEANPAALSQIISKVSGNYDFIVVDTSTRLDDMLLALMDLSSKIVLVATPTLLSVKNIRFVLDLFDKLNYPADKITLAINKNPDDRNIKKLSISPEKIEQYLKRRISVQIPSNELFILRAINKAVPVVASERDKSKSPIKELMALAEEIRVALVGEDEPEIDLTPEPPKRRGFSGLRLGR
jgi:pilus assembly protein CpaE